MPYAHLLFTAADGVATITINRPEVYNAVNEQMGKDLQAALKECAKNPAIRAVVLAGGSGKAFCSGQDLKEGAENASASLYDAIVRKYNPIVRAMRHLPKPIIAAVNGAAAGAGASLALCADYIIAADTAYFSQLFINIGLVPDTGSTYFLPRLVGMARAFELCSTGRKVGAAEAKAIGMITEHVPLDELATRAHTVATEMAQRPTAAIGLTKKLLNQSFEHSLDHMLEQEALNQEAAGRSHDHQEGVAAFIQKRAPVFLGR